MSYLQTKSLETFLNNTSLKRNARFIESMHSYTFNKIQVSEVILKEQNFIENHSHCDSRISLAPISYNISLNFKWFLPTSVCFRYKISVCLCKSSKAIADHILSLVDP